MPHVIFNWDQRAAPPVAALRRVSDPFGNHAGSGLWSLYKVGRGPSSLPLPPSRRRETQPSQTDVRSSLPVLLCLTHSPAFLLSTIKCLLALYHHPCEFLAPTVAISTKEEATTLACASGAYSKPPPAAPCVAPVLGSALALARPLGSSFPPWALLHPARPP